MRTGLSHSFFGTPQPTHNFPNEGGGNGNELDSDDELDGQDDLPDGGLDDDGEINDDFDPLLSDIFKVNADSELENEDEDLTQVQKDLTASMQAGLAALSIPEDLIPENFDPRDPKQLRTLLGDVQKRTASATLSLAMQPVQAALAAMERKFDARLKNSGKQQQLNQSTDQFLETQIPAYADPKRRPFIKSLVAQAQQTHPKDRKAVVKAVKASMAAMGMKTSYQGAGNRGGQTQGNGGVLTGDKALDLFAKLPVTESTARPANRTQGLLKT